MAPSFDNLPEENGEESEEELDFSGRWTALNPTLGMADRDAG